MPAPMELLFIWTCCLALGVCSTSGLVEESNEGQVQLNVTWDTENVRCDGTVFEYTKLCDGVIDCEGGQDERSDVCEKACINEDVTLCNSTGQCIHLGYLCRTLGSEDRCAFTDFDAETKCDEYCRRTNTPVKCDSAPTCIEREYLCNGRIECPGGEDENEEFCDQKCSELSDGVACTNGRCSSYAALCLQPDWLNCTAEPGTVLPADTCKEICTERGHNFTCRQVDGTLAPKCIQEWLVCDGTAECPLGDDENSDLCGQRCYVEGKIWCNGGCVSKADYCLGLDSTCSNITNVGFTCDAICHEYVMTSVCSGYGACLSEEHVCNGQRDCENGEDETADLCRESCSTKTAGNSIICEENQECMSSKEICGRPGKPCASNETCYEFCHENGRDFHCNPELGFKCIRLDWLCDGEVDCPLGEDEDPKQCDQLVELCDQTQDRIFCGDVGECMEIKKFCFPISEGCRGMDRDEKCEAYCESSNSFVCPGNQTTCIPPKWACDGETDCPGGEDEQKMDC